METSCDCKNAIKTSPWGKIAALKAAKLSDIISEEVARDLQQKVDKKAVVNDVILDQTSAPDCRDISSTDGGTVNFVTDMEIAKILQQQYDKEYDDALKKTEEKLNGPCKVGISFDNYRRAPLNEDFESESEEELEDPRDRVNWDRFDSIEREMHTMPSCGYKVTLSGHVVTKHDTTMNDRFNVSKLMNLPPEFHAGDGAGFDLKISNKVFNSLRNHSKTDENRRCRVRDRREDRATADFGIDEYTRMIMYKLINQQFLKQVNGVISVGKEAVVLHAITDPDFADGPLPLECVAKVFKTTLSEYKQRDKYISEDHRFKDRYCKQNTRGMVRLWAEKEMRNLRRLERAKIPCPKAIRLKKHILFMSFIGQHYKPAPKLKYVTLKYAKWVIAFEETVKYMKLLYTDANLIHADLSEYNLLWFDNTVYFIDVSQSVEPCQENAFFFLHRDCQNICKFFQRKLVHNVPSPEDLFFEITGYRYEDKVALSELRQSFKMKPHMADLPGLEPDCRFETGWERSSVASDTTDSVADISATCAVKMADDEGRPLVELE